MYEVSRCDPRLTVSVTGCDAPSGQALIYLKRAGSMAEFAVYEPIETVEGSYTFDFDELLFMQPPGRFEGRLVIGAYETKVRFDYVRKVIVGVE